MCPMSLFLSHPLQLFNRSLIILGSPALIQLKCAELLNSYFSDGQQHHRKLDFSRKWAKIIFEIETSLKAKIHLHCNQKFTRTSWGGHILVFQADM